MGFEVLENGATEDGDERERFVPLVNVALEYLNRRVRAGCATRSGQKRRMLRNSASFAL